MTTIAKPDQLLFRFRPVDSGNGISRATLAKLADDCANALLNIDRDMRKSTKEPKVEAA